MRNKIETHLGLFQAEFGPWDGLIESASDKADELGIELEEKDLDWTFDSNDEKSVLSWLIYEVGVDVSDIERQGRGVDFVVYDSVGVEVKSEHDSLTKEQFKDMSWLDAIVVVRSYNGGYYIDEVIEGYVEWELTRTDSVDIMDLIVQNEEEVASDGR